MSFNEYSIISALDNNSRVFKVRQKDTGEYFVWHKLDCENKSYDYLDSLEKRFIARKELSHPNLLKFHKLIKGELHAYLVVEFCKHGSLKILMDDAFKNSKRLTEELLCKILYQLAFTIKTADLCNNFNIGDIFFDNNYNIKLFNFEMNSVESKFKNPKISTLGSMIFEVCTLTKFNKKDFGKELKNISHLYSKEFLTLLSTMIRDNKDLKKNIDKIMCNSIVLVKITQWNKSKCFLTLNDTSNQKTDIDDIYALQIEKIKEKEILLYKKEQLLSEKERNLTIREQHIASLEKQLNDTLKKLRNCKCSLVITNDNVTNKLDSTYASCVETPQVKTSKKLNIKEIVKPAPFTRTLSEKRIRFKGHSPLKDIDFNRRRSVRQLKVRMENQQNTEWVTCSDDTEKGTLLVQKKKSIPKQSKRLFIENNLDVGVTSAQDVQPLKWTEENKKHAFELLRLMNKENKFSEIKHTNL